MDVKEIDFDLDSRGKGLSDQEQCGFFASVDFCYSSTALTSLIWLKFVKMYFVHSVLRDVS